MSNAIGPGSNTNWAVIVLIGSCSVKLIANYQTVTYKEDLFICV